MGRDVMTMREHDAGTGRGVVVKILVVDAIRILWIC